MSVCVKCCGLPSNEEAEKGASFARQTEIVNCRLRDETPAAIIIKANIHKFYKNCYLCDDFQKYLPMAGKKKISKGIDPEYLKKQKAALVRRHRQVIYLNDSEMAAIKQYCDKFRVGTKTILFREAIMEKVLKELDDNHPTLF
jgi:hypothetical protein